MISGANIQQTQACITLTLLKLQMGYRPFIGLKIFRFDFLVFLFLNVIPNAHLSVWMFKKRKKLLIIDQHTLKGVLKAVQAWTARRAL